MIQNIAPPARTRQIQKMRSTRQGPVAQNGGEGLTLQQVMETMRALQQVMEMAALRANQERVESSVFKL